MRRLIISLKTSNEALDDFRKAFTQAKKSKKPIDPHFEISFDNKKDFERFVKNIQILSYIIAFKPKSIYELAKIAQMDVSNLNKVIVFFEEVGAVKIKESKVSGRTVKTPTVEYDKVEFDLVA
jgi:predicted transcriptional regulator